MTRRLGRAGGVTAWLRGLRTAGAVTARTSSSAPTDDAFTVTLDPAATDDENARSAARQLAQHGVGATVTVTSPALPADGTQRATKKGKRKRRP